MNRDHNRIAVITRLAERSPKIGRTALMKYCYFLQTLRRVPLGYSFSLYSYGPFDSDVLSDLDSAVAVQGVKTEVVYYSGGYGYQIEPGARTEAVKRWGAEFLQEHEPNIEWVIAQFGNMSSAQLELASTIVYSDREAVAKAERMTQAALIQRVHDVKPRFSSSQILELIENLKREGLLKSIQPAHGKALA